MINLGEAYGQVLAKLKGRQGPGGRATEELLAEEAAMETAKADVHFEQIPIKIRIVNGKII